MNRLELKIPPLALLGVFGWLMWDAETWPLPQYAQPSWGFWLAIFCWLVAFGVVVAGVLAFRSEGTTVDPRDPSQTSTLVIKGVYRYTRNPMYVGFVLALIGWAIWLWNPASAALIPLFVVYLQRFQIRPEERFMAEQFGDAYRDYQRRVRRWL
ncbi:isoprenylcysteine carboxylmethyltransferase family protein [Aestuariibacter halophilus]|uniref:Isoprenylcysteine carboxylmethyltransferase family protein n=1 Tax=Fluctibacter halophilus TaxID=226011 RepID=A0ABS8G740_9ALTE|nr:isoprenylcysteine carboxylmethyltransferase family protein [Aestuariibacter halophilus]MCC2616233.1 isoprenylcysteine carboxylmethyltransferase family protein [Aestuariibacter halophilus]